MLLNQMAAKYKVAQIITHTDLDGYGAGAILTKILTDILHFDINNIKITNTDYNNAFPVDANYNLVFVSDISISNDIDAKTIIEYASKPNNLVFWFDHHKTSIEMSEYYPKLKEIPGIRDTNGCGAMLCWIFNQIMNYHDTLEGVLLELNTVNVSEVMNSKNPGIYENTICVNNPSTTPIGILLTDDYDRFVLADNRSKYYMEAFSSYPEFERNCKSKYFQNDYLSDNDRLYAKYVAYGEKIFLWKRIVMLNNLKAYGFIASFPIEGMSEIEMICLNSTTKGSMMFGRCLGDNKGIYQQYNYGCFYHSKGKKFTVSIYCASPDNTPKEQRSIGNIYDASDICKRYNGGGHPGAAGFVIDKIQFCDIKPIPKSVKIQINEEIEELMGKVMGL